METDQQQIHDGIIADQGSSCDPEEKARYVRETLALALRLHQDGKRQLAATVFEALAIEMRGTGPYAIALDTHDHDRDIEAAIRSAITALSEPPEFPSAYER